MWSTWWPCSSSVPASSHCWWPGTGSQSRMRMTVGHCEQPQMPCSLAGLKVVVGMCWYFCWYCPQSLCSWAETLYCRLLTLASFVFGEKRKSLILLLPPKLCLGLDLKLEIWRLIFFFERHSIFVKAKKNFFFELFNCGRRKTRWAFHQPFISNSTFHFFVPHATRHHRPQVFV